MQITIFGTGYVGLVTGACLAEVGHHVLCMDIDKSKVENLQEGIVPIYEPGLEDLVSRNVKNGHLAFTSSMDKSISFSNVLFVAVGTPSNEDGSADLQHVQDVARQIGKFMEESKTIVTKSTVPVGTCHGISKLISEELKKRDLDLDFSVASNPEFLKEGAAVADFMKPDRIIVGSNSETARGLLEELYAPFNHNTNRMIYMDILSSELTKYASNAMLATKISFINELANLAELVGADIEQVRQGMGSDSRIGSQFIYAGCGYGGSCFPKDVRALSKTAEENNCTVGVINAVEEANDFQKTRLFSLINQYFKNDIENKTFALWGLSFKPKTDDMREASSRILMESLWKAGASVQAYDPEAMQETKRLYPNQNGLVLASSPQDALNDADALVICTEWQHFRAPDFVHLLSTLKNPVIFDGRNLYDPAQLAAMGITYYGIGRGVSVKEA